MAHFTELTGTTPSGSTTLDPTKETKWAHWVHLFEIKPEDFGPLNNSSTGFRDNLQGSVNWSRNGLLGGAGADPIFSGTYLAGVEPYINEGPGSTVWSPLNNNGMLWTDNLGIGGNPSNWIFHPAYRVYSFHQLGRMTSIIRVEGSYSDPPFQAIVGKTMMLHAIGIAP